MDGASKPGEGNVWKPNAERQRLRWRIAMRDAWRTAITALANEKWSTCVGLNTAQCTALIAPYFADYHKPRRFSSSINSV
jgi:hypothetical protein